MSTNDDNEKLIAERDRAEEIADLIREQVYDPWNNTPEAIAEVLVAAGFRRILSTPTKNGEEQ